MRGCRNRRVMNLNLSRKKSVALLIVIVHLLIVIFGKWEQHVRIFPFPVLEQKSKPPTQQVMQCNDTYSTKLMPAGTFPLVALASFPGSGNEWVRNMIERATGYATGSVYHIQSLEKDFIGEMQNIAAGETIVSQMHDYWLGYTNKRDGQISIEKAILIMRNPYQAMIDEFIRLGFGKKGIVDENRFRSEGSLIWPAGGGWKKTRKFGHSAFRNMGLGHRRIEEKVVEEGRILVQACEMKEGEPFNPRVLITNAVGNMIACLVTGSRYDYGDPDFVKIVGDIERFSQNLSLTSLGNVFPLLYYTPLYTDFRRPMRDIISYIKSMVKQHQQNFDPLNVRDIIDLYIVELKQQREQQIPGTVEENLEWRLSIELYIAGMVTTSDSMLWAILIVAQHPQLMKEIQKEIDDVIGDERPPKMADQDALPLTVATLMEVSRIRPAVPLGLPRLASRDATLQGYHIPKDTVVIMNLWEVLNSPKYWDKPEEFNPYRFLSEDRRSVVNHPAFIPFGIGLRACLGEKLARMQMFIIFTSLLQRFTFCLADDSRSAGMKGKAGMAYSPLKYDIILKRRENSD